MLAHAIDHPTPATVILITGDRDFVYAVSVLRLRRYRVIVIAPSKIHVTLRLQASSIFAWNGGDIDLTPTQTPTSYQSASSESRIDPNQVTFLPASPRPSTSLLRACCRRSTLESDSHDPNYISSLTAPVSTDISVPSLLSQAVVQTSKDNSISPIITLRPSSLSEDGIALTVSPKTLLPSMSAINSGQTGYEESQMILPRSGKGFATETVHVSKPTAAAEANALQTPSHQDVSPTASLSSKGFKLFGGYPGRSERASGTHDRIAAWRKRLAIISEVKNGGSLHGFDDIDDDCERPHATNKEAGSGHKWWRKWRGTAVSLLSSNHPSSANSYPANTKAYTDPAARTASASADTSFTTASSNPSTSIASASSPSSSALGADRMASATFAKASSILTPASPMPTTPSPLSHDIKGSPCESAAADKISSVSSVAVYELSEFVDETGVIPLTETHLQTSTPRPEDMASHCHSSRTDSTVEKPSSTSQSGIDQRPMLSQCSVEAPTVLPLNQTLPSPQSTEDRSALKPTTLPLHFKALVEELRNQRSLGHSHPQFSLIASGVLKRNQFAYREAGIVEKGPKFAKYAALASQLGIVRVGSSNGKDWISLESLGDVLETPSASTAHTYTPDPIAHSINNTLPSTIAGMSSVAPLKEATVASPASQQVSGRNSSPLQVPTENLPAITVPKNLEFPGLALLLERLQRLHSKGVPRPFRSLVAMDLVAQDRLIFQKSNVPGFPEYLNLAVKAGLVELGGEGSRAWVSLKA